MEEVAALGPVVALLLLLLGSSRPLAETLRFQDASNYDQGGRVEEYRGECPFPAGRCPPPPPVAFAHARGGRGGLAAAPWGLCGGQREAHPRGLHFVPSPAFSEHPKDRGRDLTTYLSGTS